MTNKLFPTGKRQEEISVSSDIGTSTVKVTLIDSANPFVFVDGATMPKEWHALDPDEPSALEHIEKIRCVAAVRMGLASDEAAAHLVRGTPKIAVLSPNNVSADTADDSKKCTSIRVLSFSMGKAHPSFQLTGAVCLGSAVCVPNTIAHEVSQLDIFNTPPGTPPQTAAEQDRKLELDSSTSQQVHIRHPTGEIDAEVSLVEQTDGDVSIDGVTVSRTARRLFEGKILVNV
jgi:2-methylaconitate cis-trans-isomerase PrpF